MEQGYTTVADVSVYEFEEKKSVFIGRAAPAASEQEAFAFLEEVRAQNPEARHNVWAYKLRAAGRERQSDDGEPQKTAGMPTLEVIRHSGLVDLVVVTTRYFGGTLLGTGGLVRAYTQAAQGALKAARRSLVSSCVDIRLSLPYHLYDRVAYAVGQDAARVLQTSYAAEVTMVVRMVEGTQGPLVGALRELMAGQGSLEVSDPLLAVF